MSIKITVLGSSSALPTSERSLTAHLVNHDERFFLIDCGEGTQMQLRRFRQKFARINHIFISHLHGDHIFGLFGLVSSLSMMGRKSKLHIYAYPKLSEILTALLQSLAVDISYELEFHPIETKKTQIIYDDGKLEVHTIPLKHRIPCVGFLFKEKPKLRNVRKDAIAQYDLGIKDIVRLKEGEDFITNDDKVIPNNLLTYPPPPSKSYAFCTDTRPLESIIPLVQDVDLLYHEATFMDEDAKLAKLTYHSTSKQAAVIAAKANVKQLMIGHFSSRYKHSKPYLEEARSVFQNTILAEDGLTVEL
jgi:ribonuclease Z